MTRPRPIAEVLTELMARRGLGRIQASDAHAAAWRQAVGDFLATQTCLGPIRRGVLDVVAANSTLVQELSFRKAALVADLARLLPHEKIKDLRLRVGPVESSNGSPDPNSRIGQPKR